jgi:hypothetical protein
MDALTFFGSEPGIAFPGLSCVVANLHRWRRTYPALLENGLAAREELLQRTGLEAERRAWLLAERELYLQAIAGTLPPPESFT